MTRTYYLPGFSPGTGYQYQGWDTDDDEALPEPKPRHFCATKGHQWADTGMKWTYCQECDAEGMWDMAGGYQVLGQGYRAKLER